MNVKVIETYFGLNLNLMHILNNNFSILSPNIFNQNFHRKILIQMIRFG